MSKKYQYEYPRAANTVDMAVFTVRHRLLKVLLIKRRDEPFKDCWALPGGYVNIGEEEEGGEPGESIWEAAERELLEETGLQRDRDQVFLEQLFTFGDPCRDPRGRVITIAHYALISPEAYARVVAGDDAKEAEWFDVDTVKRDMVLAFDHAKILTKAVERLRGKIDYDPRLVRALLPVEFTAKELRRVHEIVQGTSYDTSNFSKRFRRMVEDGQFVEAKGVQEPRGSGRPARLYRFPE